MMGKAVVNIENYFLGRSFLRLITFDDGQVVEHSFSTDEIGMVYGERAAGIFTDDLAFKQKEIQDNEYEKISADQWAWEYRLFQENKVKLTSDSST